MRTFLFLGLCVGVALGQGYGQPPAAPPAYPAQPAPPPPAEYPKIPLKPENPYDIEHDDLEKGGMVTKGIQKCRIIWVFRNLQYLTELVSFYVRKFCPWLLPGTCGITKLFTKYLSDYVAIKI